MAPITHTQGLEIPWTNIVTEGVDRDVVRWSTNDLTLFFGLSIDQALFGSAFRFLANFQIVEVASGATHNTYWNAPLDALPNAPSLWLSYSFTYAFDAGVANSRYGGGDYGPSGDGCYLFRPYFMVWVSQPPSNQLLYPAGKSEYAIGEDHFLMLEAQVV